MALDSIIRKGIATVDKVTRPVQAIIIHKAWVGQDGFGVPTFNPVNGTARRAIYEQRAHSKQLPDGRLVAVQALLTFLDPIPPNGTAGRQEPVDPRDVFILPDGSTGPTAFVSGLLDPSTGRSFITQVWLGIRGVRA